MLPGEKRTLESVERKSAKLVEGEVEILRCIEIFVRQCRSAHQAIVGVERHVHSAIEIFSERMLFIRGCSAGVYVAREAYLESDASVIHVLREIGILDQSGRVSDSVGATSVHCLSHRLSSVTFSSVNRHGEIVLPRVCECQRMGRSGKTELTAGEIEGHNSLVAIANRESRQIERQHRR